MRKEAWMLGDLDDDSLSEGSIISDEDEAHEGDEISHC